MKEKKMYSKLTDTALILFFLCLIFSSPLKMLISKQQSWSETENRILAPLPHFPTSWEAANGFFPSIDQFLNDHFGFREYYIYRYQREMAKRFGQSSLNSKVITGLDGWYFFNDFNLLKDFQGQIPLSKTMIDSWFAIQKNKKQWLEKRGIKYLFLAAPNKQSIYPQFLMKHALAIKKTSRFEQILSLSNHKLPPYMINLHDLLQPRKFNKPLYYKNDSHWNKYSAYLVFQEIMKKISTWFPEESFRTQFDFVQDETGVGGNLGLGGDLTRMLMLHNATETFPQIKRFKRCGQYRPLPYPLSNINKTKGRESFIRTCRKKHLKALVFRDSFFVQLEPFFSENFRETVYLWKAYDQKNIEELLHYFKPDVVIELIAERHVFDSLEIPEQQKHAGNRRQQQDGMPPIRPQTP